jgi:cytochrome P450
VYWNILFILSTPGLLARIRAEMAPYITITKPVSIGSFSEAPKLTIAYEGLSAKCPLLKSTYFESLRLSDAPWSIRKVSTAVTISSDKGSVDSLSFSLKKGEYVTVPHDLHMRDPRYFAEPDKFIPDRFIVRKEDGTETVDPGTMRPYGGGPSICKGRVFAERECLSLVAGVLAYWDFEPADEKVGWVIPKMQKTAGVSRPIGDTRVRVRRRKFEWDV